MNLMTKRVRGDTLEVEWMAKYFPMMLDIIPEKYKQGVKNKLEIYLQPMTKEEQELVLNWNMNPMLDDTNYQELHAKFSERLKNH